MMSKDDMQKQLDENLGTLQQIIEAQIQMLGEELKTILAETTNKDKVPAANKEIDKVIKQTQKELQKIIKEGTKSASKKVDEIQMRKHVGDSLDNVKKKTDVMLVKVQKDMNKAMDKATTTEEKIHISEVVNKYIGQVQNEAVKIMAVTTSLIDENLANLQSFLAGGS